MVERLSLTSYCKALSTRLLAQRGKLAIQIQDLPEGGNSLFGSGPTARNAGNIILKAYGNITIGNIDATGQDKGGSVTLTSSTGKIDTTAGVIGASTPNGTGGSVTLIASGGISSGAIRLDSETGRGGSTTFSTNGVINAGDINAKGKIGAGIVSLQGSDITFNGNSLILGSESGAPGSLILSAPGVVQMPATVSTNSADVVGTQSLANLIKSATGSTINTNGGNVSLSFASSFSLDPSISINTNGGNITISSSGALKVNGTLNSSSTTSNGGTIRLTAPTKIETTTLNASSSVGAGGAIVIEQPQTVVTGDLITTGVTSGGRVTVRAIDSIKTGRIDSSASIGNGGDVTLDPNSNVQVTSIRAEGGPSGVGGNVDITTGRFFLATGFFTSQNDLRASISTVGGAGGGSITIRHNGGDLFTNFNVGNLLQNGTAEVLTTGAETIQFGRFFPGSYTQGNIQLITSDRFANGISDSYPDNRPLGRLQLDEGKQVLSLEELYTHQFERSQDELGKNPVLTLDSTQVVLQEAESNTGAKPALVYVGFTPNPAAMPDDGCQPGTSTIDPKSGRSRTCECKDIKLPDDPEGWEKNVAEQPRLPCDPLELTLVTSKGNPFYIRIPNVPYHRILSTAKNFTDAVKTNQSTDFWQPGQSLYKWLFKPLVEALREKKVQNVSYVLPARLRLLPIAALVDENKKFLIENYPVGLMPSLSLTDTRRGDIKASRLLAMGATKFRPDQHQKPLPSVEQELTNVTAQWKGDRFLNSEFTISKLSEQREKVPYGILHFATHGDFTSSADTGFYIQLWNQKLPPSQLRVLKFTQPTIELLVLSACKTAYGNNVAELGFAGFAHRVGVKSVLGSLWRVRDDVPPVLMQSFYKHLKTAPTKIDALVKAQQEMIQLGEDATFFHPYHWAAFTLIGNPW